VNFVIKSIDKRKAFNYLLDIGYQRNMSNRKICFGVYDPSSFNKICLSQREPSLELVISISEKLNISLEELEYYCVFEDPNEFRSIKNRFEYYRLLQDYKNIELLYHNHKSKYQSESSLGYYLFLWMKAIVEVTINHNYLYAEEILIKIIKSRHPDFKIKQYKLFNFNETELDILHDIAYSIYLGNHERYPESISIYEQLINYMNSNNLQVNDMTLFPKFCYQVSYILIEEKKYKDARIYTDIGFEYAKKNLQILKLPYLYRNLAIISINQNDEIKAASYFKKCIELFRVQGRNEDFLKAGLEFAKELGIKI